MNISNDAYNAAWNKGKVVEGQDPEEFRKDLCGAWIGKRFYGKQNNQFGWEIDPKDGPLQWQNWKARQEGKYLCIVTSSRIRNVVIEEEAI